MTHNYLNIHPLLHPHMDNHMFSDDQIGEIQEMIQKTQAETRANYYDLVTREAVAKYKEELLGKLPETNSQEEIEFFRKNNDLRDQYIAGKFTGFNECLSEVKKPLCQK